MATIQANVNYEDDYVQPTIFSALQRCIEPGLLKVVNNDQDIHQPLLQWKSYETLDFEHAVGSTATQLMNAYVIRKALIRKHYLSHTVHAWVAKHPTSALQRHFKPSVDFELDYAEFLDDALVEAFELRESFEKNESRPPAEREWWILKPGMSDRGQGIRLFSTEEELTTIFEGWEANEPDSEEDGNEEDEGAANGKSLTEGIVTSHLRHFVAQPYIYPPLLVSQAPFSNRKFHIRTYVVASGALRAYVYDHMLALFASKPYSPPWESTGSDNHDEASEEELLQRIRDVHLSNTCVQSATPEEKAESVFLLDDLPVPKHTIETIKQQIRDTVGELFRAALAQPTNFQALPQSFEIFGLDFLVSSGPEDVWLLEVNAFPDFAQTGDVLKDRVVGGLFEEVVKCVVCPRFGVGEKETSQGSGSLVLVMDAETGLK